MLTATFQGLGGIGPGAERKLWNAGCLTWNCFSHIAFNTLFEKERISKVKADIDQANRALSCGLFDWFINRFSPAAQVRLLPDIIPDVAFVDIETTGLSKSNDRITVISTLRGNKISIRVSGINLEGFLDDIAGMKLLCTFNGRKFDLPFLRKEFNIDLLGPHIDILEIARDYSFFAGMKKLETRFNFRRPSSNNMVGSDAPILWKQYQQKNNTEDLRKLLQYNAEDAWMISRLASRFYKMSMEDYPIDVPTIKIPEWSQIHFQCPIDL